MSRTSALVPIIRAVTRINKDGGNAKTTTTRILLRDAQANLKSNSAVGIITNSSPLFDYHAHQLRTMAATAASEENIAKKKTKAKDGNDSMSSMSRLEEYFELKAQRKQRRTELYNAKVERRTVRLPKRRNVEKRNYFRKQFRSWFDQVSRKQLFQDREARRLNLNWKLRVGVMLERLPVIFEDTPQWEEDYNILKAELMRYDKVYPKELNMGDPMDRIVMTEKEILEKLPKGFKPAPRETEADKNGNIQTLDRRLKTRVYLAVKCKDTDEWLLPTVDLAYTESENDTPKQTSETILDAAKRAIASTAGPSLKLLCLGNCPVGVDTIPYDEDNPLRKENGFYGEKIYYMRVQYDSGDVMKDKLERNFNDWGWLEKDEMVERIKEKKDDNYAMFYKYLL